MSTEYQAGPPSQKLALIGEEVTSRLLATAGMHKLPIPALELFAFPHFLSQEECAEMVAAINAGSEPSAIYVSDNDTDFRTSYSCNFNRYDPDIVRVDRQICDLLGIEDEHGETLQGQRYQPGQQFKAHHDFFHTSQAYWPDMERTGGQRSWTAMIFLNQPELGGETDFPAIGIKISPQTGMLLAWNNMGIDGAPNLDTIHAGLPVIAGAKYIVTKWFRERPWG